jgi:hypothetical protein
VDAEPNLSRKRPAASATSTTDVVEGLSPQQHDLSVVDGNECMASRKIAKKDEDLKEEL